MVETLAMSWAEVWVKREGRTFGGLKEGVSRY